MNKRFSYDNIEQFKKSIEMHAQKNSIEINKQTIEKIYIENKNFNNVKKAIESKTHEQFIEDNPNEIFNLIQLVKSNINREKIIFESMQAYLRSVINTLK